MENEDGMLDLMDWSETKAQTRKLGKERECPVGEGVVENLINGVVKVCA